MLILLPLLLLFVMLLNPPLLIHRFFPSTQETNLATRSGWTSRAMATTAATTMRVVSGTSWTTRPLSTSTSTTGIALCNTSRRSSAGLPHLRLAAAAVVIDIVVVVASVLLAVWDWSSCAIQTECPPGGQLDHGL